MLCCTVTERSLCSVLLACFLLLFTELYFCTSMISSGKGGWLSPVRWIGFFLLTSVGLAFGGDTVLPMQQRTKLVEGDLAVGN